jgi:hypothetical protein
VKSYNLEYYGVDDTTNLSTLIQVNQINVESQNNVHRIESPFWCSCPSSFQCSAYYSSRQEMLKSIIYRTGSIRNLYRSRCIITVTKLQGSQYIGTVA